MNRGFELFVESISGDNPDVFVHGGDLFDNLRPGTSYRAQTAHGEAMGLGSRDYELVRL